MFEADQVADLIGEFRFVHNVLLVYSVAMLVMKSNHRQWKGSEQLDYLFERAYGFTAIGTDTYS